MELRILGPLEVLGDDGAPVDVGGARPRTLLVDLALAQGHAVSADQLLEDVWSGERAPARNNLQVHVSRLRRALGEERIATRAGGYALELPREALDATRFDRLAAAGRAALHAGAPEDAAVALRAALDLWRGAPLADFADYDFVRPVIARLEESRFSAIADRVDADLMLGRHGELIGELEALVREHPLRERIWAQLMLALYRAGRQSEALRAYQRARSILAEELGVEPGPALRSLEAAVLAQDPALAAPPVGAIATEAPPVPAEATTNLPAATTVLVGRETEVDATATLVREHRLTTIVGTGGVGKTRLAIAVGSAMLTEFEHGVFFVDLAPGDAHGVATAIGAALGVEAEVGAGASTSMLERLRDFLRGRETLLVLDNCEHVIARAAKLVDDLLGQCARLRVLATSREPVMVNGEVLWPLAPLELDDAVTLFTERARAVAPTAPVSDAPETVRAICERLDCLPLAIELAAARMRAFTLHELEGRLDDRFRLLTAGARTARPRQQTLRAVIDWSNDLLFDDERRVFERVSLFAGTFDVAAAEAVASGGSIARDDVADLLARLVDKSLVTVSRAGRTARYRLLQTLAEYGRERLARSGDVDATRARHARHVAARLEVPDGAHGIPAGNWYGVVGELLDDIRVAMSWAIDTGDADTACSIAVALGWFWNMGGRLDDTWRWMTAALALGEPVHPARRVRTLAWAGLAGIVHDSDRAIAYGAEGVARARELGDDAALGVATMLHGSALADFFNRADDAAALFAESARAFAAIGDAWSLAMADFVLAAVSMLHCEYDTALPMLSAAADRFASLGNAWGRASALRHVADIQVTRGRYEEAEAALQAAISGLYAVGAVGMSSGLTARLAYVYALLGRVDDSDSWFREAIVAAERQRYVPTLALAYNLRGIALRRRDRLADSERFHRDALALYADRRVPAGLSLSLASLGYLAELRGDADEAEAQHRASLDAACEARDRRAQALALEGLAGAAALRYEGPAVGRDLGAAAALRESMGWPLTRAERVDADRARRAVGDEAMDEGYVEGHADPDAVIAAARSAHRANRGIA